MEVYMAKAAHYVPPGYHTLTPCFTVDGAMKFLDFLKQTFGAEDIALHQDDEGKLRCGEVRIGDSIIMIFDSVEQWKPMPSQMYLYTKDTDALYNKAIANGAKSIHAPMDMYYGDRSGGIQDAWGNYWWIATRLEDLTPEEIKAREPKTAKT
jgi:uncharacterized glyoxalase superfamily protein PhnB